ncbi:hypothetical protein ASPWEDRAFT_42387 [Aspergillus wentii DTO 134E9]|uniref:Uncharacterized protein n=1 Tax=Aspergillus wentii DTO 134E9 TaxID=1073089 RepID=A0A1L9RHI2_ASPWE|nr:uncharacterized protein ASPWEDRAFT_42387 [Aspergillus wentii DTO 134E9]OJJ34391.1 hypothetical protein ASPWEDRAFT_42387 [Aspergillus wentii DTO 134E9]
MGDNGDGDNKWRKRHDAERQYLKSRAYQPQTPHIPCHTHSHRSSRIRESDSNQVFDISSLKNSSK